MWREEAMGIRVGGAVSARTTEGKEVGSVVGCVSTGAKPGYSPAGGGLCALDPSYCVHKQCVWQQYVEIMMYPYRLMIKARVPSIWGGSGNLEASHNK